ncbi:DUF6402 family protein [Paraburkholderia sp. SIMBA_030]|uniref:DUF6402 family protein n=1 Tax=Paraburkholderia sp. SIMBA_030 TaxID=3085773 RepID=UPI00397B6EE4
MAASTNGKIRYFKIGKLLWRWKLCDGDNGCSPIPGLAIAMDKAPPALPSPAASTPTPTRPWTREEFRKDTAATFSSFKKWLDTPWGDDTPAAPKPEPVKQGKVKTVPAFDIQEIPGAMRKEMMPVGAKLMERWFAGRLNYSPTDDDEQGKINQDGKPYPPDMYDTTTVKLDWVLKYARAKEKYDYLITEAIRSPRAIDKLKEKLIPYKARSDLFTTDVCGDDSKQLHKLFQFQFSQVDGALAEKIRNQLIADIERSGIPDDLTAALGSFNIYVAIGSVRFSQDIASGVVVSGTIKAQITGIWVYVTDGYTFTDKQGDRSQYLGHWSSDGVIVIPLDGVAATSRHIPYVESPVTIGNPVIKWEVYYPVHNSDFRQWQIKHKRGGDFIIYTDRRFVPVNPAIAVYL